MKIGDIFIIVLISCVILNEKKIIQIFTTGDFKEESSNWKTRLLLLIFVLIVTYLVTVILDNNN